MQLCPPYVIDFLNQLNCVINFITTARVCSYDYLTSICFD